MSGQYHLHDRAACLDAVRRGCHRTGRSRPHSSCLGSRPPRALPLLPSTPALFRRRWVVPRSRTERRWHLLRKIVSKTE